MAEPGELFAATDTGVRWRISAAWARRRLDCTLHGITRPGGCDAGCCKRQSYWPPRAGDNPEQCDNLGPTGCVLGDTRPAVCHLYPLKPNAYGTIVAYRGLLLRGHVCEPCSGHGPLIIEAIEASLVTLFGAEQAERVVREVRAGRDTYVDLSPGMVAALKEEQQWEADNVVPRGRDWSTL